jgi:glycosyltransferase involved in cell wall biosynthesis
VKLIASLIVRNELKRYLEPCVAHLLEFCDEIRVLDDRSDDGTREWLAKQDRVMVQHSVALPMFVDEGKARNWLLRWTFEGNPTHVLAIDADEFASDGAAIRATCEDDEGRGVWSLTMEEVWKADEQRLWTREDGLWKGRRVPVLWRAPRRLDSSWRIEDKELACGREPLAVRKLSSRAIHTGVSILHFGWTNEAARAARYQRYVEADNGKFHARRHLDSIMWPDRKVRLARRLWPQALEPWRAAILERANGTRAAA